jgi:hypothetical protein
LARTHIATLSQQSHTGTATYLYLVQRIHEGYDLHRACAMAAARDFPIAEQSLVPPYYLIINEVHYYPMPEFG